MKIQAALVREKGPKTLQMKVVFEALSSESPMEESRRSSNL